MSVLFAAVALAVSAHAVDAKVPRALAPLPRLSATPIAALPASVADDTAMLKSIQLAVKTGNAGVLAPEARLHRFLFAPGFSWDAIPDYFEPNIRRLRDLGLNAEMIKTDPLATNAENGRVIAAAVKKEKGPVVLIGHSKGGVDAIVGLQNDKTARKRVAKLVTIQSPYAGTAVADWFRARPWFLAASLAYTRLLNPWRMWAVNPFFRHRTIEELSTAFRAKYADKNPFPNGGPEVFSIGTRVTAETAIKLLLWISAGTVKQVTGQDNDGIVSPEETVIPNSRHARFEHVGHIDTITDPSGWRHKTLGVRGHDPKFAADLTEAVVRWIFETAR